MIAQLTSIWPVMALPVFGAVLISMLALMSGFAFGQNATMTSRASIDTPHGNFYDACPVGHRVEFQIGSRTLYIDPHWLELASEIPLWQRFGANCPSEPVKVSKLYFDSSLPDVMDMPGGLGRPFLFLKISDEATLSPDRMTKLGLRDAPPLKQTAQPYVEDITEYVFGAGPPPQSRRVYRVVYPGVDDKPPNSVEVSCGGYASQPRGPGPGRACFTPIAYSYLGALTVKYEFRQDRLPIANAEKDHLSTMREPEAVLAFDAHIRTWLDSFTEKQ